MDFSGLDVALTPRGQPVAAPGTDGVDAREVYRVDLNLSGGSVLASAVCRQRTGWLVRTSELRLSSTNGAWRSEVVDRRLLGGYADRAAAVEDTHRAVIRAALADHHSGDGIALRRWAGWQRDMVLLLQVTQDSSRIFRVREDGRVVQTGRSEYRDEALGMFAEAVEDLADEFDEVAKGLTEQGEQTGQLAGLLQVVIVPWLNREAAQARLDATRHQFYWGAQETSGYIGNGPHAVITMSALARGLYTDRANLHRVIRAAAQPPGGPASTQSA